MLVVVWLLAAYVILPAVWKHYEHLPALETAPKTTVTGSGIPGDPLNVIAVEVPFETWMRTRALPSQRSTEALGSAPTVRR